MAEVTTEIELPENPSGFATPITDAINAQFDQWDKQAEEYHKQGVEYLKKQGQRLLDEVKSWVEKKEKEVGDQKEDTEKSVLVQALDKIQELWDQLKDIMPTMDEIVDFVNKIKNIIEQIVTVIVELANAIAGTVFDLTCATITLPGRSAQLGKKLVVG